MQMNNENSKSLGINKNVQKVKEDKSLNNFENDLDPVDNEVEDFESMNLNPKILKSLNKIGFDKPTLVQSKVVPIAMDGRDLIVLSKTGSGKTASFGLPIVNTCCENPNKVPKALILTPTRELALQVCEDITRISQFTKLRTVCVYGQHNISTEVKELDKGVDIIFGTPGRVLDHLRQGTMDLSELKHFVLDEADRMLAMGFIEQIEAVLKFLPKERQTMLLSATMPFEIMNISWQYMKEPLEIKLETESKTVDKIKQLYYRVENNRKRSALFDLIRLYRPENLMIFCNTRWQVDRIKVFLENKGFSVQAIHGGVSQNGRTKTMKAFKSGKDCILVATDVAARGIHVDDLEMVINYDVPNEKDNYVHRIGRTGRVGKSGLAITMACSEEMFALYEIEEHIGAMISEALFPDANKLKECKDLAIKHYKLKKKNNSKNEKYSKDFKRNIKKNSFKNNKDKNSKDKNSKDKNSKDKYNFHDKLNKKAGKQKTKILSKKSNLGNEIVFKFNGEESIVNKSSKTRKVDRSISPNSKRLSAVESKTKNSIWKRIFRKK